MNAVGWGLIGIGKLADIAIAPAINRAEDSVIAAVCSRDLGRATEFAERHSAGTPYDDYDAMLADPEVDVVFIATPNGMHKEHVLAAVGAGKHVLVEKPLALTVADGREMVDAADAAGVLLAVGFHLRHKSNNIISRDMIAAGDLGALAYVDIAVGAGKSVFPYDTWRADPALAGGGTTLHQGTHAIDLLGFLTGRRVLEVTAQMSGSPEDVFAGTCRLEGDVLATISSHQVNPGTRPDWMVVGRDAWLECRGGTFPTKGDTLLFHKGSEVTEIGETGLPAYAAEVNAFLAAVRKEAPVNGTGLDGLTNIAIVTALYEANGSGKTTAVANMTPGSR